ncbi:hypothetical protein LX64_02392 [Chitinophaga skermanii]|uniref:DUF4440 domain-containing protein n=1 Tax=Chitinophaga skermanii TaxID=331697 RepID=A0A327QU08_9BACT|nr:hypothetical protein [Chitinophaga skermanii]RAJ05237.1 hypothetical protein LX64_02392 [Chitinophaga skermanii]
MNNYVPLLLTITLIASCQQSPDLIATKQAIRSADSSFSALSKEKGHKTAFLSYIDSSQGTLLRPGRLPFTGLAAVALLTKTNDSGQTLTWEPLYVDAAASGELGYTYGTYKFVLKDTTITGTYCSIWKKNTRGEWKFVLDTGT